MATSQSPNDASNFKKNEFYFIVSNGSIKKKDPVTHVPIRVQEVQPFIIKWHSNM